jgi:hypothetical protein
MTFVVESEEFRGHLPSVELSVAIGLLIIGYQIIESYSALRVNKPSSSSLQQFLIFLPSFPVILYSFSNHAVLMCSVLCSGQHSANVFFHGRHGMAPDPTCTVDIDAAPAT